MWSVRFDDLPGYRSRGSAHRAELAGDHQRVKSERSAGAKALWAIGIALFPVLGLLFWLLVGVRRVR